MSAAMVVTDVEREREPTEELLGEDTAPTAARELFDDFEQQRVLTSARALLFGRAPTLHIGRYRVERRLGAGGMGEVYLASDDELRRKVAVKRVLAGSEGEREQQRLRREAQALARLTHANVVQVYEIGEHQGRTFIAMQYVEGMTLAAWLAAERRSWPAIVERFVAAGRGLAAAHEAGLVHRDFKLDNVLVGDDGEVRVVDFGLVLAGEDRRGPDEGPSPAALDLRLSVAGAIMGTIRYMPLEQLRGEEVDARSDQFSFCVALYEALWGRPPFELDSAVARIEALERGVPTPPPRGLPAGLWRVIRRGLSREPGDRWPDMNALIGALEQIPRRRRALAWAGVGTLGLGLALGIAALVHEPAAPEDPCAGIERELAGIWDADRRAQLDARFAGDPAAHADGSRIRVLAGLDAWAGAWTAEREQICRAREDRSLAPELAQLRSACLIRQQQRAGALVELLIQADDEALRRAVAAVAELPSPTSCASELALLGVEAPGAEIATEVEELRATLERAHELRLLGRAAEARELAERARGRAVELEYPPLLAEAEAELGKIELVAGSLARGLELLRSAIDRAEINHHEHLAADLWIELSLRVLGDLDDPELGARELARAEVARRRAGIESPRLDARLSFAQALLAAAQADHAGAEGALRAAIAIVDDQGEAGRDRPAYLAKLATMVARRDPDEALALHRSALEAAERDFGPAHPEVGIYAYDLAVALQQRAELDEARPLFERAVSIWTTNHAEPHRDLARAERTLAQLALVRGELDEAEAHARALATVQASTLPAGHVELGDPELLLAAIAGIREDHATALSHCEAALALWEPSLAPGDSRLTQARSRAAAHLVALGRLDEAEPLYRAVVEHAKPRFVIPARNGLAGLALIRGRPQDAVAHLRAIDELIAEDPARIGLEGFNHTFLWALVELRRGRPIAGRVEALAAARETTTITAEQIEAWLERLALTPAERRALGF